MKQLLTRSEFTKHTFTLIAGAMLAQLLPIAVSPIISRLYSPDNIAVLGLYMSIVNILLPLATGSFEFAIMLPKKEEEAVNIFAAAIIIAFICCMFFLLIELVFKNEILSLFNAKSISQWLIFVPLSVFILSVNSSLNYFFNRKKEYKIIALNKVNKNWGMALSQLLFGFKNLKSIGLVCGQLIGDLLSTVLLGINFIRKKHLSFLKLSFSRTLIKKLIFEYIEFPFFTMPTILMNNVSSEILTILTAVWFNSGLTGAYYFTMRILSAPMALIGSSVAQTFFQKFSVIINEGKENPKPFMLKVWGLLFLIGIVPLSVVYIWGEELFVIIFGQEWREAGKIISIMAPMTLFTFISAPTSSGFMVLQKQYYNLLFGVIVFIYRPVCFYLGYKLNDFLLGLKILVLMEILNVIAYNSLMWLNIKKV